MTQKLDIGFDLGTGVLWSVWLWVIKDYFHFSEFVGRKNFGIILTKKLKKSIFCYLEFFLTKTSRWIRFKYKSIFERMGVGNKRVFFYFEKFMA